MPIERVRIADYEAWGRLVKRWAKGEPGLTRPATPAALEAVANANGVGMSIPGYVTTVEFVQRDKETLLIRLPPQDMVEDSEKNLAEGGTYNLPSFYRRRFGGANLQVSTSDEKLAFHAERIGDYTITLCV